MNDPHEEKPASGTWSRRSFLAKTGASGAAIALGASSPARAFAAQKSGSPFLLGIAGGRSVNSLRFRGDAFPTDYIEPGQSLGHIVLTWRSKGGAWQHFDSEKATSEQTTVLPVGGGFAAEYRVEDALAVTVRLVPSGDALRWTVQVRNLTDTPVEVGDLALPLPMHTIFKGDGPPTASVLKHSFVSGNGSFLFWMRSNSVGPYLLMTPDRDTSLEYWKRTRGTRTTPPLYSVYIHSKAEGEAVQAAGGRWRQPHTNVTLAPKGKRGDSRSYGFHLTSAADYDSVRNQIAARGLLDVEIAPGMTVPSDLFTCVAFRSANPVAAIVPEHPDHTTIEPMGRRNGRVLYRVRFSRLGENLLTVRQADGRVTRFEFFATEPLETLIHKRGAFVAGHQHRDPAKWYNGLLAEWNMDSHVMLGPDNYDRIRGWRIYEVTCDDPGLSKPAFLASKLAEYPDQAQVTALDDYIQHFVWGGLQRTTEESDSYGIYGILDWKRNRDSSDPGDKGRRHLWRPYDYPHIVVMYWGMYRVARDYPALQTRLDRDAYLERCYGTALALFTVPKRIIDWEAYQTGFYNEVVIPSLIEELEATGRTEKAATLRGEWEKKVVYFVTGGPNLFGSEYAFDSTGFESTGALARYALDRPVAGVTRQQANAFTVTQMQANIFCRGLVEKAYYYYGSDYRSEGGDSFTLTYMSQMGGWAVLDHALHDGKVPDATVRLGYASFLSAWALMNTGTAESGYGYWFPSQLNDGGTGGGFEPAAMGETWLNQPHHRGPWYYSSEADLGYCGALRCARTVIADDPIFGTFCFGGTMQTTANAFHIVPKDGVRRRLSLRTAGQRVDVEVMGARFAKEKPIRWPQGSGAIEFQLEREASASGKVKLQISGLPQGKYRLQAGDTVQQLANDGAMHITLDITQAGESLTLERTT